MSQDLVVSVTVAVIKAKPHVRQAAIKQHSTFASTSKEKKAIVKSFNRQCVFIGNQLAD